MGLGYNKKKQNKTQNQTNLVYMPLSERRNTTQHQSFKKMQFGQQHFTKKEKKNSKYYNKGSDTSPKNHLS